MITKLTVILLLLLALFGLAHADMNPYICGTGRCNAGTDEVGNRDATTSPTNRSFASGYIYCNYRTADCTGSAARGALYHNNTDEDNAVICLYSAGSAAPPDSGDLLLATSSAITGTEADTWYYSTYIGVSLVKDQGYYVCVLANTTNWYGATIAGATQYYASGQTYPTCPATLNGVTSNTSDRLTAGYVEIQ